MQWDATGRLTSDVKLTRGDFDTLAIRMRAVPMRAVKRGRVAARQATASETVVTYWNGKETSNTAAPGDWIVTNLSPEGVPLRDQDGHVNVYVITAGRFPELYRATENSSELGPVYAAISSVLTLRLPGGFDIVAPWGERQQGARGYLLLNGDEVYGNHVETFEATYALMPE